MTFVYATHHLAGDALGEALFADWFALADDATLVIDSPHAWAGVVWRIGARAHKLHLLRGTSLSAADAFRERLCDEVVAAGSNPLQFGEGKSALAMESAAALIALRGGDILERSEFARLFAIGEPQRGLRAFLEKRRPEWT
jgi:enoyl-CoA hydratase/carnithine racemase